MSPTLRLRLAVLAVATAALACDNEPAGPSAVRSVTISTSTTVVGLGDTLRLAATAVDTRGRAIADAAIGWTSLEPAIAEVDGTGLVTGVELGEARIVAASGAHADTVVLTVVATPQAVTVEAPRDTLVLGDTATFTVNVVDAKGQQVASAAIEWSVSDTTVLRVDEAGLVRAVEPGTASVVAAAGALSGSAEVTVHLRQVPLPPGVEFVAVSVGYSHACALTDGGQAYCWGSNESGQLGTGDYTQRETPAPVVGGRTFTLIDAGQQSTCGLTTDSKAYCWGRNTHGSIGLGTTSPSSVSVPTLAAGGMSFVHIGVNQHMGTCAATPEHVVYCWGHNDMHQLGRTPPLVADTAIAPLSGDARLSWVDGSAFHTCGLTPGGAAYCWGERAGGNTGIQPGDTTPEWVPNPVAGGHAFTKLATGDWHTCGITASGAAYCWGMNTWGQLGNGVIANDSFPTPVPVTGGHTFVDIVANRHTTCALTASGEIYCWGLNEGGSLGNLWMQDSPHPVRAGGDDTYHAIGMGYGGTCAVRTDGQIVCWDSYCEACSVAASRLSHGVASPWNASPRDWQAILSGRPDEHVHAGLHASIVDAFHPVGDSRLSRGEAAISRGFALPTGVGPAAVPHRL